MIRFACGTDTRSWRQVTEFPPPPSSAETRSSANDIAHFSFLSAPKRKKETKRNLKKWVRIKSPLHRRLYALHLSSSDAVMCWWPVGCRSISKWAEIQPAGFRTWNHSFLFALPSKVKETKHPPKKEKRVKEEEEEGKKKKQIESSEDARRAGIRGIRLFTFHEHHKQQKNRVAHLTRTQSTHTHTQKGMQTLTKARDRPQKIKFQRKMATPPKGNGSR